MAKKSSIGSTTTSENSLLSIISSVDKSAEILSESKTAVIKDYIDSGNYILNACLTGSIFRGMPTGRILTLAGPAGCGKSYLALSFCRNAQKKGYTPIYMDSESAIDIEFVKRLGCDPSKFIIKQVTTISEVSTFIANICKKLMELPEKERENNKLIFVLDSLGNLTSDKEYNDILEGSGKRDMTKQQEIKALFRTNMTALGKLNIPMIVCSHVYQSQDLFSRQIVGGGSGIQYNSSLTLAMSTAKLDDKESDKIAEKKVGEYTKTGVLVTAKPEKSRFTIPQKVQFQIPFFKEPNPYVGLEKYITWENSGIMEGIMLNKAKYDALGDLDKKMADQFEFEFNGEQYYVLPKVASIQKNRTIVVRHLGRELKLTQLYTPQVLTEEVLRKLDDEVIRPNFELPSHDSIDDLSELIDMETGEIMN